MQIRMGRNRGLLLLGLLAATTLVLATKSESSNDKIDKQQVSHQTSSSQNARQDVPATFAAKASETSSSSSSETLQVAEKKQGDHDQDSLINNEEYVQIKPEEINVNENGKEIVDPATISSGSPADRDSVAPIAEYKSSSVDEELNAHLAQDTISQLESAYRPYAAVAPQTRVAPSSGGSQATRKISYPDVGYMQKQPSVYKPIPAPPAKYQRPRVAGRLPPSYITLKGKLTGINSLISQYPHPAPGYPHQVPRHLPRGAAAGYAAFRDFVRAHASKYKHSSLVSAAPVYPTVVNQAHHSGGPVEQIKDYGKPVPYQAPVHIQQSYQGPSKQSGYVAQHKGSSKSKLSVTQAYIPQIIPGNAGHGGAQYQQQSQQGSYSNSLAQLYGNHAPQGVGKPEYNKDYGMVIHYPQATVYTEPMTVEQLHKLTGGGISQVIEQLQYNLAHGHRDESNVINSYNRHHIGNGITIHAKEYQTPGKGGHYIPTTAAVLSTSNHYDSPESSGYQQGQNSYDQGPYTGHKAGAQSLGSGYDRVKQAVAASQDKYGNNQQKYPSQPVGYEQQQSNKYGEGNGEPLSAITGLIGSELEALYKANAALTKHLEPEIHATLQNYGKSPQAREPLTYTQHDQKYPLALNKLPYMNERQPGNYNGPQPERPHRGSRGSRGGYRKGERNHNRYQASNHQHPMHQTQNAQSLVVNHRPMSSYGGSSQEQQNRYQHQQTNLAADHALNQQMNQLLQEIQAGDEQYNGKAYPTAPATQGYPNRLYNKQNGGYNVNQNEQHYKQPQSAYHQLEGLEIPQGPNDQIGEIADLIETLRGTFDANKHEQVSHEAGYSTGPKQSSKMEDVKYLATALGQVPSYAMQVPVAQAEAYEQKKNGPQQQVAYQQQAPNEQHYAQQQGGYQQQQQQAYGQQEESHVASGYGLFSQTGGYGLKTVEKQNEYQQPPTQTVSADYSGLSPSGGQPIGGQAQVGQHVVSGTYPVPSQPLNAVKDQPYQQQTGNSGYSNSEHTSVINHLVPVQPAQASSSYEASLNAHHQAEQQPLNQVAVAAPTDSQYQQAQSLSSFVDSLPTDYQELLRQPPILSGNSSIAHLAALGQETSSYNTNSTVPHKEHQQPSSYDSDHVGNIQQAYQASAAAASQPTSYQATSSQNLQPHQQQQQPQQQYATVKK